MSPEQIAARLIAEARIAKVQALLSRWDQDERDHLIQFGQHLPASLSIVASQLREALDGDL